MGLDRDELKKQSKKLSAEIDNLERLTIKKYKQLHSITMKLIYPNRYKSKVS